MEATKKKTNVWPWVIGGLVLAGGAVYALSSKPKMLSAVDKFILDANTPGTDVYNDFDRYNNTVSHMSYADALPYHLKWHLDEANKAGSKFYQYYTKPAYAASEVVSAK